MRNTWEFYFFFSVCIRWIRSWIYFFLFTVRNKIVYPSLDFLECIVYFKAIQNAWSICQATYVYLTRHQSIDTHSHANRLHAVCMFFFFCIWCRDALAHTSIAFVKFFWFKPYVRFWIKQMFLTSAKEAIFFFTRILLLFIEIRLKWPKVNSMPKKKKHFFTFKLPKNLKHFNQQHHRLIWFRITQKFMI